MRRVYPLESGIFDLHEPRVFNDKTFTCPLFGAYIYIYLSRGSRIHVYFIIQLKLVTFRV